MALTRRGFFERIAAITIGAVLARPVQPVTMIAHKNRMWCIREPHLPTFEHRELYGLVNISNEMLGRDDAALKIATDNFIREMDRRHQLMLDELNRDLLNGAATGTPKGFLSYGA